MNLRILGFMKQELERLEKLHPETAKSFKLRWSIFVQSEVEQTNAEKRDDRIIQEVLKLCLDLLKIEEVETSNFLRKMVEDTRQGVALSKMVEESMVFIQSNSQKRFDLIKEIAVLFGIEEK